ncbi:MAG TPA: translocation/assembly module TamB domain-containing protein [Candidatus Baltobacteraceae bacterium]|nr:translocation/assembly module TamB domain-containing protein [Candidatus Baltobacteraceae bacterium]
MRKWVAASAVVVILVVLALFFRNAVVKASLGVAGLATGYSISAGEVRLGSRHGALVDVHISRGGEPVLDAGRVDIDYNPRDLLPGSRHRFGISTISIDAPHITLIHHKDGTYNVAVPAAGPPAPAGLPNPTPIDIAIHVRNASATLIDTYRFYAPSRRMSVGRIDADVQVDNVNRTWYRVTGYLEDTGSQHFRLAGSIDYRTGFALHHIQAKAIPIATVSNYFINSNAAHVLGGTVRDMDLQMWAFDGSAFHMSGGGKLAGGSIVVKGLDSPIGALNGPITLFDSGFASSRLTATVGHLPIVCSGGIFDFARPQFRLGVIAQGDLRNLHEIMKVANGLPISGGVGINALIEGGIDNPVLMIGFKGKHWNYDKVPLENPHGQVALLKDHLIVLPFHTDYGAMKLHVQGDLQLGKQVHSTLAVHAIGPSARIPYLGALLPDQPVLMETLMHGDDLKVDALGYLVSLTHPDNLNGFFSLDRYGEGVFGPMFLREPSGGTLVAGFSLDRKNGGSTFWASAENMRLRQPETVRLPGVDIPEMPPIDAQIENADIAGTGSAKNVVIGGSVHMSPATIAGVPFDNVDAHFAGPFAASRLSSVRASGPWGDFKGTGTFGTSVIAASGDYNGTLEGLHQFLGDLPAHGGVSGRMSIAIEQGKIFIQAQDTRLANASIQSIPISAMSGTMSFYGNVLKIYNARATAAGGDVDVAGTFATGPSNAATQLAIVTAPLQAAALHGLGVPLEHGTLRAAGTIAPGGSVPDLNAGVTVSNGDLLGYAPFDTSTEIAIHGGSLQMSRGLASLGGTVARMNGSIDGLASRAPAYDILADVPAGSIDAMAAMARFPTYNATGSFDGRLRIAGSGTNPRIAGNVQVPEGTINGLGFRDAAATIDATARGATISNAHVTVGSTRADFSAAVHPHAIAFALRSNHATLSDFNDYFDTGDTLAGTGTLDVAFSHFNNLTFTSGTIDIDNLRYRSLPIGDTDAKWSGVSNLVQGGVSVGGEHGRLNAEGTIGFAQATSIAGIVSGSRYNISASLQNLDLTTWLPALGYPQLPVTGRVDGSARVQGAYPHLQLSMNASVRDGTLGPLSVDTATLSAQSAPGDRIDITKMVFALPGLQADGSGSFGVTPAAPVKLQLHAKSSDVAGLIAQATKKKIDLTGTFESTVAIGGSLRAPTFAAGVEGSNVDAFGIRIPAFFGQVQLQRRDLIVRNAQFTFQRGTATIAGALPLQLSPLAFGAPNAPLSMDVSAQDIDLGQFAEFLGNGTRLGGTLAGHLGISGTVGNPQIFGQIGMTNTTYVSSLETTPIANTVGQLSFNGTHASLDRLHANLGAGSLDASGTLSFGGGLHGGPLGYTIAATARGAQLSSPVFGSGTFDGNVSFGRVPGQLGLAKGTVAIRDAAIPLGAFLQLGGPQNGAAPAGPPLNLGFDLAITAGKNVRVRGGGAGLFGLDIGGTGQVHLAGTLQKPTLAGTFNSAGGSLTYIDHAFKIQKGQVTFDPANGVLPDIYAVATAHVSNPDPNTARNPTGYADITAQVTGTVPNVKVSFTTNPPGYTQDQIVALLLPFGGLVGPIQFTDTGVILPAGQLAGAPVPGSGAALPDIFERRQNGTFTIGQEAFNILNTQFASGILSPIESALGNTLGLSDVNLTVDYGGNVGLDLRRLLGTNVYALYGTTFTVPVRQTFGVAYQPNAFTSAQFTMFVQQGAVPLFYAPNQTLSTNARVTAGQAQLGQNGFTFLFQRLF